jgi:hypothetical protein
MNPIRLHVAHAELDRSKALTFREVRSRYHLKGRGSRPLNLETLRRWANPKRGFRPVRGGAIVIFPALLRHGEHLTMPDWADWFFAECDRLREESRR